VTLTWFIRPKDRLAAVIPSSEEAMESSSAQKRNGYPKQDHEIKKIFTFFVFNRASIVCLDERDVSDMKYS